jgi:hypothetical protein
VPVEYRRSGDFLTWDQGTVKYHGSNIRRERGKPYALVTVSQEGRILDEDDIATLNREERNRLANSAHVELNGSRELYPKNQMQHDMLLFCRGLFDAFIGSEGAVRTAGALEPTEPLFLLQDYVLEHAGTILFAPPGRGKSWTGQLWATCIDAGVSSFWQVRQAPVLFINLERSRESLERRQGMVNAALGLPRDYDMLMMHERGKSFSDIFDAAQKTIEKEGIELTVIDSLSRSGVGSLVKDETANKAMDYANALQSAWLFLAHTPRSDESHTFGSQMFDAAADLAVQMLTAEPETMDDSIADSPRLGIGLKVTKANDTAKPPLRVWTYEFDRRFGLTGIRQARRGEWPDIEDDRKVASPQDRITAHLLRYGRDFTTNIADTLELDQGNVSRYLKDMLRHDKVAEQKEGTRTYYFVPDRRHGG